MFNLGPPHSPHAHQGRGIWTDAWVSGLHERSLIIQSLEGTHLVSARLHPLGAVELLGEHVGRVVNNVVETEAVFGGADQWRERLLDASSPLERFVFLEQLARTLRESLGRSIPEFLWNATRRIDERHGNVRISELHDEVGVSRRHLSVMFSRHVGVSPKRYAAIKRFTWTLEQLRGQTSVDWSQLAIDSGYSDQSHLVRDFRRVGAATPQEYLRRVTPDASALIEASS